MSRTWVTHSRFPRMKRAVGGGRESAKHPKTATQKVSWGSALSIRGVAPSMCAAGFERERTGQIMA